MKLKLILNPASAKSKECWPEIQKILEGRKIIYDLDRTEGPGHATLLAKKAVQSGFDTIISVGGDGLSNEIANGMIGSDATFGVIPCGEADDFPKMLGLSKKRLEEACQVIIEGFTRKIDVGMVNGRYFLNVVGIGYDGEINERKALTKKYLHGFFGYLIQTILVLLTYKPKPIKIKIDGITLETSIFLLCIGNGRCCGGGFLLTPAAVIDDELLDICLIKYPGKLRTILDIPKVPKGDHVKLSYVTVFKAREINISSEATLTSHIDGEIAKAKEYQIKILPKKLKVLAKKII
jgi:YegS/Rv2252/BmrU family lipid kinase